MANQFKIPKLNPFWFVPNTASPGIHFDDSWACEQIKSWERQVHYKQKWKKSDTTKLQIRSSLAPDTLKVYDINGVVVKTIAWTAVVNAVNYKVYELTFDISDKPEGTYFIYMRATFGSIDWASVSEPIHSKTSWPDTILITYKNSYNKDDVTFTTGVEFKFRLEAAIMDMNPERDRSAFVDQTHDVFNIYGTPYETFQLEVGKAPGVAPYILSILNRIFTCDYINIENRLYQSNDGSKVEMNRIKGYPLVGGKIEIIPAQNRTSLEFNDTTEPQLAIVTAYQMETNFFAGHVEVEVIDVDTP